MQIALIFELCNLHNTVLKKCHISRNTQEKPTGIPSAFTQRMTSVPGQYADRAGQIQSYPVLFPVPAERAGLHDQPEDTRGGDLQIATRKRAVGKLSGGQRRRIDVARALLNKPKILILDEPTTGLDPQTRKTLWKVIEDIRKKDKMTVLLTTHYMEEAADAYYVIIIDGGKISAEGTPLELKNKYAGDYIRVYGESEEKIKALGEKYEKIKDGFRVSVKDTETARNLIIKYPETFTDFEVEKGKMDDVFLTVTGKKLTGEN